ncbi:MAG: hypothetical protein IPK65_11925 [Gammaproteobacteria bacterium]|nr:hypothetical protein [Gammaproteobacteria bacterium]
MADLTPDQKQELDGKNGVLVDATESGPASKAGIAGAMSFCSSTTSKWEAWSSKEAGFGPAGLTRRCQSWCERRGSPIFLALEAGRGREA